MTKWILLFKLTLVITSCFCQPNPIAYYPFDGNAADISGNGLNGIVSGAILSVDRCGNLNSAYYFDGIDDVISVPDNNIIDIGNQDYTLVAWIKTSSINWGRIISKGSSSCETGYMMRTGGSNASIIHLENAFQSSCMVSLISLLTINDNNWHCIAGVVKRDSFASIYIDDTLRAQQLIVTSPYDLSNNLDLLIGANYQDSIYPEWFKGTIDDVKIFNSALRVQDIKSTCSSFYQIIDSVSICAGDSFQLPGGNSVNVSGIYHDTILSSQRCDSIIITNLSVQSPIAVQNIFTSICQGSTYQLPNGNIVSNAGIYQDTLQTSIGCDSIIITTISFLPQIQDSLNTTNVSCYGSNDGRIEIFAFNSIAPYIFHLSGTGTNSNGIFDNLPAGKYSYTIIDNNGCLVIGNCIINQPDEIIISTYPNDTTIDTYQIVQLIAYCNYPNASFHWNPTIFLTCDTCYNTISAPENNVTYTVTVGISINGKICIADTTIIIRVKPNIYSPNAFTPNDDYLNDFFQVIGNNLQNISKFDIQIYNRWGQQIFQSNDINFKWDGTFKKQKEQIGVYFYVIKYKIINANDNEQVMTGNLTILK